MIALSIPRLAALLKVPVATVRARVRRGRYQAAGAGRVRLDAALRAELAVRGRP